MMLFLLENLNWFERFCFGIAVGLIFSAIIRGLFVLYRYVYDRIQHIRLVKSLTKILNNPDYEVSLSFTLNNGEEIMGKHVYNCTREPISRIIAADNEQEALEACIRIYGFQPEKVVKLDKGSDD